MTPSFEPTRSFCYQFGRYTVLPEIEAMPQVKQGAEFRMVDLVQEVLDRHLTPEQQQVPVKKANSDRTERLHSIIKFWVSGFECVWSVCLQRSSGGAKPDFVVARQSTFDYDETGF